MTEDDKIVPFGKYEGQPVTRLVEDDDYAEWLTSQPWFRQKFGDLYQIVLNYGAEPQDTPEHNEMQAKFLDDDWCISLASLTIEGNYDICNPEKLPRPSEKTGNGDIYKNFTDVEEAGPRVSDRNFEADGWDVVYTVQTAKKKETLAERPPCTCEHTHEDCPEHSECHDDDGEEFSSFCDHFRCDPSANLTRKHCSDGCIWSDDAAARWFRRLPHNVNSFWGDLRCRIECKPTIGDDFPSVMRQVKRYESYDSDKQIVLTRSLQSEAVAMKEVRKMFSESGISLVLTRDVKENLPNP